MLGSELLVLKVRPDLLAQCRFIISQQRLCCPVSSKDTFSLN
jgi:hypothetical protein